MSFIPAFPHIQPSSMSNESIKKWLPWLVAMALFMEQLDTTIVNTAVPSMAESLGVSALSLKSVVATYILSLAVGIPISGWLADRFGTRRVFTTAISIFVFASFLCGISVNVPMLVFSRLLQGLGAAMMMPVGRLAIVRTFPKSQLLKALNFVIIPALIGPLLGPTLGGLIVHVTSWRAIFFVNIPIGMVALYFVIRHMPDYYGEKERPLDGVGLILFGSGVAILSWVLEVFGDNGMVGARALIWVVVSLILLGAYVWHARRMAEPLLRLSLFKIRTFRLAVLGGFITRLGVGGLPFLLPLMYQVGMKLPAWQSGLMMMPTAMAAMGMKVIAPRILKRLGYRQVLIVNTLMIGVTLVMFSLVTSNTPFEVIVLLALCQGFFNSLQFTSMNSMAYADVSQSDASMASTMASSFQQISLSFGLAIGSIVAAWFLGDVPQTDSEAVMSALHHAFTVMGLVTIVSAGVFYWLKPNDGQSVSQGEP